MSKSIARRFPHVVWMMLVLCVPTLMQAGPPQPPPQPPVKFYSYWQLAENQPDIRQGGRANTIAIHPVDSAQIFVTSETGGLFKSVDHGRHWSHVDSLPVYFTEAVAYLPSNPNVVFVSAQSDFKTNNGGGIWRSANGGATWSQMPLMNPNPENRLSAHEISIRSNDETIFVATSEGVFSSSDAGLNWTFSDAFANSSKHIVVSVLATPTMLLAAGPSGVRRWDTSTAIPRWRAPATTLGSVLDMHAFGPSPLSPSHAYLVDATSMLLRTEDGGVTWMQINAPARDPNSACGGISFIKTTERTVDGIRHLNLFFGERCGLHRLDAVVNAAGTSANYGGLWHPSQLDHGDTRDLAFDNHQPFLLGTDGGLHTTANGGDSWNLNGNGREGGYNALQVTEVRGQAVGPIGTPPTTDLYFGTQDNNLWSSNIFNNIFKAEPAEGSYIEAERRVAFDKDSEIEFRACGNCVNKVSGRHFANTVLWKNPPTPDGSPAIIRRSMFVQPVQASANLSPGLALTEDSGAHWRQFAAFTERTRDLPKLAQSGDGDPFLRTIVYQAFGTAETDPQVKEINKLMRIHKRLFSAGNGTVFFPAMTGFGGLGINPTQFAFYQVFGIDPGNPFHVIAPDVVGQRMMETRNGGESWTEIPGLTSLVTDNGRLLFRTNFISNKRGEIFPIVTAVSFSPQDPNLVVIGTSEGGIFRSNDNGATWKKIDGTSLATYITSFFWESANTVHVSTYGRGLWKLRNRRIAVLSAFDDLCGTACEVVSNDSGPSRPPFSGGIFVYEGTVLAARTDGSQLKEVFVTPGSSVAFIGDENDPQWDITITETESVDSKELASLPAPPKGWITKGLVFTDGDKLTGTVFGDAQMSLVPPPSVEDYKGSTESPTSGRPYIRLTAADPSGMFPSETFDLAAINFVSGKTYEVLIDGELIKLAATADRDGSFNAKLSAPEEFGYHVVEVRAAGEGEAVIQASLFLVKHGD